jgi:uncharacterized phage-like protein YoqJ
MNIDRIGKFRTDLDNRHYFIPIRLLDDYDYMIANISLLEFYDNEFESSLTVFNEQFSKYKLVFPPEQYLCQLVVDAI